MLRYAVEFNMLYGIDITVCVDARNKKAAVKKASMEKFLRKQVNNLLDACLSDYGICTKMSRKKERNQINGIIHNPINVIRTSVYKITKIEKGL